MKTINVICTVLLLIVAVFLVNGNAQNLPKGAITQINTGQGPIYAIAYSRSANQLAVAADKTIHIYDASTYKELRLLTGHTDTILALTYSPNGKVLVSGSSDKTTRSWDTEFGNFIRTHKKYNGPINAIAFDANGEEFKCGGNEHADIWYWYPTNINKSGKTGSYMPTKSFTASSFSSTGKYEARAFESTTVLDDMLVTILTESGEKLENSIVFVESADYAGYLSAHTDTVNVLTIHENGNIFATGSADKTIQLWSIEKTNKPIHITNPTHVLSGHTRGISSLDFSVNGKLLASGSSDKTVRVWDVEDGKHLHTFSGHSGEIGAVTFLGDKALANTAFAKDKTLASGSSDGTLIIWDLGKVVP